MKTAPDGAAPVRAPQTLIALEAPAGVDAAQFAALCAAAERASAERNPAHDALHVARVAALARTIAHAEQADETVCVLAAVLHELVNLPKHHPESARSGDLCAREAEGLLRTSAPSIDAVARAQIVACIRDHAFSKGVVPTTREAQVLQDADRLDAIGAIGVARCMATCAETGTPFYSPVDPLCDAREPDDKRWGIDHFFRKLRRLPAGMHTATARALAVDRAAFCELFLSQLRRELSS